jgi:hypothetical protein
LNLLFYITSPLNKDEINKYIDEILLYIKERDVFDLDDETVNEYKKNILDYPIIEFDLDDNWKEKEHYLMKHKCGILVEKFNISEIDSESFMNDFFKVALSDDEEPILLTGPTGYKTF